MLLSYWQWSVGLSPFLGPYHYGIALRHQLRSNFPKYAFKLQSSRINALQLLSVGDRCPVDFRLSVQVILRAHKLHVWFTICLGERKTLLIRILKLDAKPDDKVSIQCKHILHSSCLGYHFKALD